MSSVQATVKEWYPGLGGSALRDDGVLVVLPSTCLEGSVFRFLRLGQRVQLDLRDDVVTGVGLP